jgi:ATP-binding cassette subfamily B protein/subfamily B ATP-binding cassette protein MsbA
MAAFGPAGVLLRYAAGYFRGWVLILGLTLISCALSILQPWPMQFLIDHILGDKAPDARIRQALDWIGATSPQGMVLVVVVAGLILFALGSVLESILTISWIRVGQKMVYDLMGDLFARVQRRSVLFHSRSSVGELMSRTTADAWSLHKLMEHMLFTPLYACIVMAGMALVMARIDVTLTLLAFAVAPPMAVASIVLKKPVKAAARERRKVDISILAHVQQILSGIPVVQAFAAAQREQDRFEEFADAALSAQRKAAWINGLSTLVTGFIATAGLASILLLGSLKVLDGHMSVGTLLVFVAYLATLQAQMKSLVNVYVNLQGIRPNMEQVVDLLSDQEIVPERDSPLALPRARGEVSLEHVTFGYEPGRPVLREVSFAARPGQLIAIVGPTGAGKSTLAGLLPRLFDPWSGTVRLDGHDVRDLALADLRRQVALVLQEPFLFPITVAENIAYGRPDAPLHEVEAAAVAANAHEFIRQLPGGYQAGLGARGATLSGGQRQRIAIARAFLMDAPVLVLDEPTSALDTATEAALLEALNRLMQGRTTFLIAHRLSTVRNADRILVLEDGRIEAMGTHEELLARGGLYARLVASGSRSRDALAVMAGEGG